MTNMKMVTKCKDMFYIPFLVQLWLEEDREKTVLYFSEDKRRNFYIKQHKNMVLIFFH